MLYPVSVYSLSDIGLVRENNEDSWKSVKNHQFFVLADGMGGHQAGEIASRETVEQLCRLFEEQLDFFYHRDLNQAEKIMKGMIQDVNAMIYRLGKENPKWRGMGTTLCCLYLHPKGLVYAHVGDSRIYRFRKGKLEQLTQDHSLLRELIELGQLSQQQAQDFLYKNIITKAIGTDPMIEPAIARASVEVEDILMMCTDGLSDLVSFEEMQEIMSQYPEEEIAALLVKKAKQKGGHDNITVVLIRIQDKCRY